MNVFWDLSWNLYELAVKEAVRISKLKAGNGDE